MRTITEELNLKHRVERDAEKYYKKYSEHMQVLESGSPLSRVRKIQAYDYFALGRQLDAFTDYKRICEEEGTVSQLGRIPDVAFDVLTVNYGASPISVIATVQPIDEERGTVYFKNTVAYSTRGNMTKGQTIFSPDVGNIPQPFEFAGDTIEGEDIGTTASGTLNYGPMTIANHPLRPYKVEISIPALNLRCMDDGAGKLLGYDLQGDINYSTGVVNLELKNDPGSAQTIYATYSTDFEASEDIPKIGMKFTSKSINARIWALKDTIGLEQSYALKRRFGLIAEDEVASELVAAINSEIVSTAVRMLLARAQGNVDWPKAAPAAVSYFEHKQSFKDAIQQAEAIIIGNSGRGTINILICGRRVAAVIGTLPGFKKISDGASIGPHIFGTLDGVTIVRVPNDYVLDADKAICVYRGVSSFEAALV